MGANVLNKAIDVLVDGIEILYEFELAELTASLLSTSSISEKYRFERAKASFSKANAYLGLLHASAKTGLHVNGRSLLGQLDTLLAGFRLPETWCRNIYSDLKVSSDDTELAYQMYDAYITAVNNLRNRQFKW